MFNAEIGCGAGEILRQMQTHLSTRTTFHGYEISPQAFRLCKQKKNFKGETCKIAEKGSFANKFRFVSSHTWRLLFDGAGKIVP
jgi:type I restriction-modification system DNA methylase subunit